jgi:hypothetical protein
VTPDAHREHTVYMRMKPCTWQLLECRIVLLKKKCRIVVGDYDLSIADWLQ